MNMSKPKHLLIPMISLLTLLLVGLDSCIRPEAPNAEADILSVEVEGITPREKPLITNTAIKIEAAVGRPLRRGAEFYAHPRCHHLPGEWQQAGLHPARHLYRHLGG